MCTEFSEGWTKRCKFLRKHAGFCLLQLGGCDVICWNKKPVATVLGTEWKQAIVLLCFVGGVNFYIQYGTLTSTLPTAQESESLWFRFSREWSSSFILGWGREVTDKRWLQRKLTCLLIWPSARSSAFKTHYTFAFISIWCLQLQTYRVF